MRTTLFLFVAALLIATPAVASVTITAVSDPVNPSGDTAGDPNCMGCQGRWIELKYNNTDGQRIRAMGLDVQVSAGVIEAICGYKTGESTAASKGFGIFPGSINLADPENPVWGDPIAPNTDPGALGGLGTTGVTLEMGSLYVGEANAPGNTGSLCKLLVTAVCDVTVTENSTRGGIVMEDPETPPTSVVLVNCSVKEGDQDCLWEGRVFDQGLTVSATHMTRWTGLFKPHCWCCEAQKYGNARYTGSSGNRVDTLDLAELKKGWFKRNTNCGYYPCTDFNLSGRTDTLDLARLKQNWFQRPGYCP